MKKILGFIMMFLILLSVFSVFVSAELNKEYISDIKLYFCSAEKYDSSTVSDRLSEFVSSDAYSPINYDINGKNDDKCIVISKNTTYDKSQAITNIIASTDSGGVYQIEDDDGCIYYLIPSYSVSSFSTKLPFSPLNIKNDTSNQLYLYYTTDTRYSPISDISFGFMNTSYDNTSNFVETTEAEKVNFNTDDNDSPITLELIRYNDLSLSSILGDGKIGFVMLGFSVIIFSLIISNIIFFGRNKKTDNNPPDYFNRT